MAIQDIAGNPLTSGSTAQLLGYEEVIAEEALPLRMYDFLIAPIREEDQNRGELFVQRFLQGPQQLWSETQERIFDLKDLLSIEGCPDDLLQYLKNTVGWTKEPITERVTRNLDATALRRLIANSVQLWKTRGPEDTIINTLQFLTGQRVRVWNWFDFRWILEETPMGEDHQGRDPWIVDLPSEGDDYHRFNVRIVDPGTEVGRELVRNVARLMRPCGERIEISYLLFLDRFATDRDNIQWEDEPTVEDGVLKLEDTGSAEGVRVAGDAALAWSNYSVYWRIKGATEADYLCSFYWTDEDNFYQVRVNLAGATTRLILRKVVAGAGSTLVNLPLPMNTNEWLGIRVAIQRSGGTNLIRVYLDGDLQIDTTDPDHTAGKVGFGHWAGGSMQCDEVEVFPIPMDTDTVDINPS